MSILTCLGCTARYAVGLPHCPHCGAPEHVEGDAVADPDLMPAPDAPAAPSPAAAGAPKAKAATKPTD